MDIYQIHQFLMKVVRLKDIFSKAVLAVFWTLLFFGKGNEKMVSVNNRSAHFIYVNFRTFLLIYSFFSKKITSVNV